jgi:hypothetical protein
MNEYKNRDIGGEIGRLGGLEFWGSGAVGGLGSGVKYS